MTSSIGLRIRGKLKLTDVKKEVLLEVRQNIILKVSLDVRTNDKVTGMQELQETAVE